MCPPEAQLLDVLAQLESRSEGRSRHTYAVGLIVLARIQSIKAYDMIARAIESRDPDVYPTAVYALGFLRDERAQPWLEALAKSDDQAIRRNALPALKVMRERTLRERQQ